MAGSYTDFLQYLEAEDLPLMIQAWRDNRQFKCVFFDTTTNSEVREDHPGKILCYRLLIYLLHQNHPFDSTLLVEEHTRKISLLLRSVAISLEDCLHYRLINHLSTAITHLERSNPCAGGCVWKLLELLKEQRSRLGQQYEYYLEDYSLIARSRELLALLYQ